MMKTMMVGRIWGGALLVSLGFFLAGENPVRAQGGQGIYVTQATARLSKLIDMANKEGFKLADNKFSIGGGWLKQGKTAWVPLFTIELKAGTDYRILASGDGDAKDVDVEILDSTGKVLKADVATDPNAVVNFRPEKTQQYLIRIRLFDSRESVPCVCVGIVMEK